MEKLKTMQKERLNLMRQDTVMTQKSTKSVKSTISDILIKIFFWLQCGILLATGIKDIVLYSCGESDASACTNVFIESRVITLHAAIHFVCAVIICVRYRKAIPSKIVISFIYWSVWTSFLLVMHLTQLSNYLQDLTKSFIIALCLTIAYLILSFVQGAVQFKFMREELSATGGDEVFFTEGLSTK